MGGGYDISNSQSESATLSSSAGSGTFTVGGGLKIPEWFWPVTVLAAAAVLIVWLTNRK